MNDSCPETAAFSKPTNKNNMQIAENEHTTKFIINNTKRTKTV